MLRLLQSDTELLVEAGFIYLPMVFDPAVDKEVNMGRDGSRASGRAPQLTRSGDKYFLKSLNINSILDNYGKLDPQTYEDLRRNVFNRFLCSLNPASISIDQKLKTIVFQVIPHFARKKNRLRKMRGAASVEQFLDLVGRRAGIPARFYAEAGRFGDTFSLKKKIRDIGGSTVPQVADKGGLTTAKSFHQRLLKALESKIVREEKDRLEGLLQGRDQYADLQKKYIALLLFINETGDLELNGAGFFRDGDTPEYYVYVHTGQYALKDHKGRLYLFPDCRVAVPTRGPLVPYVVEKYKHPFLWGHESFQKICVAERFIPEWKFSASGAIRALEEGINALFYGYNSSRGNGYHRLDDMRMDKNSIVFDDLRILREDPRIASGEIEVKNDFY